MTQNLTPEQIEVWRTLNTGLPSKEEQARTQAARDAMKARLSEAWKEPK